MRLCCIMLSNSYNFQTINSVEFMNGIILIYFYNFFIKQLISIVYCDNNNDKKIFFSKFLMLIMVFDETMLAIVALLRRIENFPLY